jgi:glycosyltransferase involved in cell wall biosynthesis
MVLGEAMTHLPLVSIVTPSYNQAAYLEVTINSVLNQDYPNIEYLVLDGGSTDGSIDIINRYSDKLAYWISSPDKGQADAINRGLAMSKGDIVAWINSDDVYLQGAIGEAVDVLTQEPDLGMVYGDGIMVDSELRVLDRHWYRQLTTVDLLSFEVILQPAVFMRRKVLEQCGYLNDDYDLILDHELWTRIAVNSSIRHVPSFWALERTHPEAKTIALAEGFVNEAEKMIAAAGASDTMAPIVNTHRRRIYSGLNVFAARRLIDAKLHRQALLRIMKATSLHPLTVLRYWYKLVQAAFSVLGLDPLFMWYRRTRRRLVYRGEVLNLEITSEEESLPTKDHAIGADKRDQLHE